MSPRQPLSAKLAARSSALPWPTILLTCAALVAAGLLIATGEGSSRWLGAALLAVTAVAAVAAWRQASGTSVEPVVVEILKAANGPDGDLSKAAPEIPGRLQELTAQLNQFIERVRTTLEEMQQHTIKVSVAAARSRQVAEEASRHATRQEEHSELIFNSSNETAAAIEELSRRTSGIAEVNSRNLETARHSATELRQVAEQIANVTSLLQDFQGTVGRLESTSSDIRDILGTVQSFAAQTNMLALNAAIEAARAGETGRGFAVVAGEVRALSKRTHDATAQIQAMIQQLQADTAGAAEVMERGHDQAEAMVAQAGDAGQALESITGAVDTINDVNTLIASAAEEQSAVAEEINRNITNINDVANRSAAGASETAAAGDELARLAQELRRLVGEFKV